MDAFNLKPVPLSETVYSETINDIHEARRKRDGRWLVELHIEAFCLLDEAGLINRNKKPNPERYEELLWHLHLDAQVPEGDED